jgi:hypothetical protein
MRQRATTDHQHGRLSSGEREHNNCSNRNDAAPARASNDQQTCEQLPANLPAAAEAIRHRQQQGSSVSKFVSRTVLGQQNDEKEIEDGM